MNTESDEPSTVKQQSISITIGSLVVSALNGIVAYIAVYFFKPLLEKFIKHIKKDTHD